MLPPPPCGGMSGAMACWLQDNHSRLVLLRGAEFQRTAGHFIETEVESYDWLTGVDQPAMTLPAVPCESNE